MDAVGIKKAHLFFNFLGCQILAEFTRRWPVLIGLFCRVPRRIKASNQYSKLHLRPLQTIAMNRSQTCLYHRTIIDASLRRIFDLFRATAEEVNNPTLLLSCKLDPITPCRWVRIVEKNAKCGALCS